MKYWKFLFLVFAFLASTLAAAPIIYSQPESQTVIAGEWAYFDVSTDDDGSYTYQWRKNGNAISDTERITGTRESSLLIDGAVAADIGNYSVLVRAPDGSSVGSVFASLTVITPPEITQDLPFEKTVNEGTTLTLTIKASGTTPMTNQWYFNGVPMQNNARIAGVNGTTLRIANVQPDDEGDYYVTVDNAGGQASSQSLMLLVNVLPRILAQPVSITTNVLGDPFDLYVDAEGTDPMTYQWRKNGQMIPEATEDIFSLDEVVASDAGNYTVQISNPAGNVVSSNAQLVVLVPPQITQQPQSKLVKTNTVVTLSARATGTPPLAFQWYFQDYDHPISGATSSNYTFTALDSSQSGDYFVTVSNIVAAFTEMDFYVAESDDANITVVAETTPPTLTISSPADGARWSNSVVTVSGKATDNVKVKEVQVRVNGSDTAQIANGTTNWTAAVSLVPGTNLVRIVSVDLSGNKSATLTRRIVYVVPSPITVQIDGLGSVTPNLNGQSLEIGRDYSIKAVPGAGQVFAGWSGGLTSTNPTLRFTMQANLSLQAKFIPNPFIAVKGVYNGLFLSYSGVAHNNSGFITFTLSDRGGFSGKLTTGGLAYPFSGALWVDGKARVRISRPSLSTITLDLGVDLTNQTDQAGGPITDSRTWSGYYVANRTVYSLANPFPTPAKYTLALAGEADSNVPPGFGATTVNVTSTGVIQFRGNLADGTLVSQNMAISKNREWPLFLNLYRGGGSLFGWVTFTNQPDTALTGTLNWTRPRAATGLYTNGFATELTCVGSDHVPPALGNRILSFSDGQLTFTDGNLLLPLTNMVFISTNNLIKPTVGTNLLSLTGTAGTGVAKGSFIHPDTKRKTAVNMVLLQDQNIGLGYFLGTNTGGGVRLESLP